MRCESCGAEVMNGTQYCHVCGNSLALQSQGVGYQQPMNQGYQQPMNQGYQQFQGQNFQQPYGMQNVSQADAPVWLKIVSLLFWIVGVIMYFVKKDKEPVYAKSCLTFGLIGLGIDILWGVFI